MNEAFITHMRKIDALAKAELSFDGISGTGTKSGGRNPTYTQEDITFMVSTAGQYTCRELSDRLHRSVASIGVKAKSLGITLKQVGATPFTAAELDYIQKYAHMYTYKDLAEHLNRSTVGVRVHVLSLGVQCIPAVTVPKARAEHERVMA